jgi:hypothetical protein
MNKVGQIFVVLILIMSVFFCGFAIMVYSTHRNWREEILRTDPARPGYKARLEEAYKKNQQLATDRQNYELQANYERQAKIQALAKAEAEFNRLQRQYQNDTKDLAEKTSALAAANSALHTAETNLANATAEVQKLRGEIAKSQEETDNQIKRATALADQLAVASGQNSVLGERNMQLTKDVTNARQLLTRFGAKIEDPVNASTIKVTGTVTAVSRSRVELSIGMDDGVRIGQELDIYRGDKYVGRVRIVDAKADVAVGTILSEYQQLPIQRGDNVSSGLKPI